jgi:DNA-binding response OmpR family regulator
MADVLESLNHSATVLPSASVTIDEIASTAPELLIVDLRLQSSVLNDGWGVIVGSRAHPRLRDVPIVLCSADHEFLHSRADEISALADVHPLRKPFGMEDVGELIRRLLERHPAESNTT